MKQNELEREFVVDHRKTSKAIQALMSAVSAGNDQQLQTAAEELDQVAGPHIAFEECWLYPLVGKIRGKDFEEHLKDEHQEVVEALTQIRQADSSDISDTQRAEWLRQLQIGLDHVVTCGTLLSHLTVLSDAQRASLLANLQALRKEGTLWTTFAKQSRNGLTKSAASP